MFAFLSVIRGSVQSPLCVFFRYALYNTWLQSSLEMFSSIWQQSEDGLVEGRFCWWLALEACSTACPTHVKSPLSRAQPRPQALMVLVLSIFVLLCICKVLCSDLLAVLGFNSPQR